MRVLQIRRGTALPDEESELVLEAGNEVALLCSLRDFAGVQGAVGLEVMDPELPNCQTATAEIAVTGDRMAGEIPDQLKLISKERCLPLGITCSGINLPYAGICTFADVFVTFAGSLTITRWAAWKPPARSSPRPALRNTLAFPDTGGRRRAQYAQAFTGDLIR